MSGGVGTASISVAEACRLAVTIGCVASSAWSSNDGEVGTCSNGVRVDDEPAKGEGTLAGVTTGTGKGEFMPGLGNVEGLTMGDMRG